MKLQRFIGEFDLTKSKVECADRHLTDQLRKVFRFTTDDNLIICDGKGNEALAKIDTIQSEKVVFTILESKLNPLPAGREAHLYQAILKKENFEMLVQKATECGVTSITPIITERTVKLSINHDRLLTIAKEASEQSGRTILPMIHTPIELKSAIDKISGIPESNVVKVILDPNSNNKLRSAIKGSKIVHCLIGPEGGFSQAEIILAEKSGIATVNIGQLILRGETAGIISSYLLANENGPD